MHVHAAVRRLAHQGAQAAIDQLVALAAAQVHVAVRAQRMDAGAEQRRDLAQLRAQRAEHADGLAGVVAHRGPQLQHAVGDLAGHLLGREPGAVQQILRAAAGQQRRGVDGDQLLLDPEAEAAWIP